MKDLKKLKSLTNNPLALLFGFNHKYLNRFFTWVVRMLLSIIVLIFVAIGVSVGSYDMLFFILILLASYYVIDKLRIEKHLNKYNKKFYIALDLLKNKQFFKGFRKLVKFGLKDSILWIMDNEPELLTDSLLENVDKEQFTRITKQIENRDIEGVVYSVKRIALKF